MGPKNIEDDWRISGISHKYPSYRNNKFITQESWLKGKNVDDGAEGLWRIKDTIYDLTEFAKRHPGGAFWIEKTKGTDITEPFESHHIFENAEKLLSKFEVRPASSPRNYKFTLLHDGFYMKLKRRVRDKLKSIEYKPTSKTKLLHSGILASLFALSWVATVTDWMLFKALAGLSLCWLGTATHNYFHQRDNWRMYTFNLTLMNFSSWRISHALSHHVYANSLHDLEMSLFEPIGICWVPNKHYANKVQRIISVIISPILYFVIVPGQLVFRVIESLISSNVLYWHDLIGFTLPAFLYLTTDIAMITVIGRWLLIVSLGSFFFSFIGLTAAHHDPRIYHDGDAVRADRDWGLFQLDTIIDRGDIKWSDLLVLTHFGEHALHHLFPTLDHGVLKLLYPELQKTMREFNTELREINHIGHIKGQSQQLLRIESNPMPPDSKQL